MIKDILAISVRKGKIKTINSAGEGEQVSPSQSPPSVTPSRRTVRRGAQCAAGQGGGACTLTGQVKGRISAALPPNPSSAG